MYSIYCIQRQDEEWDKDGFIVCMLEIQFLECCSVGRVERQKVGHVLRKNIIYWFVWE